MGMVRTSVEQGRDETTIELKRDSCDGTEKHWSEEDLEQQIGSERRLVKSSCRPSVAHDPCRYAYRVSACTLGEQLSAKIALPARVSSRRVATALPFARASASASVRVHSRDRSGSRFAHVESRWQRSRRAPRLESSVSLAVDRVRHRTPPPPPRAMWSRATRAAASVLAPSARPPFPRTSGYGPRTPPPRWPPRGTWPRRRRRSRRNAGGRARCRARPSTRR